MININYSLIRELSNDLEMNGRQFISRDIKIQKLKEAGEYQCEHGNDLIYYHIKSAIIHDLQSSIFTYLEMKSVSDTLEIAFRKIVEDKYYEYKSFHTHDEFMKEMDRKYGNT